MTKPSLSRQAAAVEFLIKLADGVVQRPKPAQMRMILDDAKAALERLTLDVLREGAK